MATSIDHGATIRSISTRSSRHEKTIVSTAAGRLAAGAAFAAFDASAASPTIRVQCEQRGEQRATVSVDGNNLAPIAKNLVDGNVTGKILAPDGSTAISDTVACRIRRR